jgi:hypothetical protein
MPKKKQKPAAKKPAWRNRIVSHGEAQAGQLLANEANWRTHGKPQQDAMRALLGNELGWLQSVIVNRRTAPEWGRDRNVETMLDGHMRVQLALRLGEETPVPVTYVDLTRREERLALASFDRVGALAGTDDEVYDVLLADLADVSPDISAVLVRQRRVKGLSHEVQPCTCCRKGCTRGCGCFREE